ncbi:TolC family protein [Alkalimarinus alittae]|uniref:TolC family protein n=1 Tax=Alkalimarinus alittae TaxID=2961619 RepID=A0ABY6MZQ7_9ALTE|nr:TolC family protein [Alkalimarinus alittae]UZE95321.1 TolC family protein [Alkalimarinus alittae]
MNISMAMLVIGIGFAPLSHAILTIDEAQKRAIASDLGITQTLNQSHSSKVEALSQSQLPDPVLVVGAQNLPTDTFKFDQEPMTQFKVGIRQMFPQGDTLSLKELKLNAQASSLERVAKTRYLTVTRKARNLWLEVLYWERAKNIIEEDEALFTQLLEVTNSLYSVGSVQQKDVLRAELELSRLREKIIKADRQSEIQRVQLSRWIGHAATVETWPEHFPNIHLPTEIANPLAYSNAQQYGVENRQRLLEQLQTHPMLLSLQRQVDMADSDIQLSKQQYQPAWGVELNYGYRDGQNNDGSDRSDFVSAMVNVSMPLFTHSRQDKSVQGAVFRKEAQQNAYQDKLTEMVGEVQTIISRLGQVEEQMALFNEQILGKARLQAESSLNAYQADAADFAEVMRAYISEQRDRLDYERLVLTRLQLISDLQFYFLTETPELTLGSVGTFAGETKQ